jgi:hypothetical protein
MEPRTLARAYGVFIAASGIWPVFHLRSFEAVTGPKADGWLVKTVGLLLAGIGGVLVAGSRQRHMPRELVDLGLVTTTSLGAIDLWYAGRGRISKVYLVDAALQGAAAAAFIWALRAYRVDPRFTATT